MSDERLEPAEAELQEWIDGLLRTSPGAPATVRGELTRRLRRQKLGSIVLKSVAAAAAVGALLLSLPRQDVPVSDNHQVVTLPHDTRTSTQSSSAPAATFVGRSDLIVVPLESPDPTVTVVQIYPTTITNRRWQREAALQAALTRGPQTPKLPIQGG
ncbi:MAG: hypothetical protein KDA57_11300 [Planctomycetales bacterium]|nr:hypothetical protein [Planctomycetales bacterium]